MANEIQVWNRVMAAAMAIPGVKVERKEYLSMTLMHYCEVDVLKDIIDGHRPSDFIDKSVLEQLAKSVINKHLREVTAISAAMGLPGGWFMAGTIPTDIAQSRLYKQAGNSVCVSVINRIAIEIAKALNSSNKVAV